MPTDAYWAVAVLVLLVLLAIAVRANARLERERNEQRKHVDFLIKCDGANGTTISGLKEALERAQDRNHDLTAKLAAARKNDNRDAKGRYAKA